MGSPAHAQTVGNCAASDSPLGAAATCGTVCSLFSGNTALVCDFSTCGSTVEWTITSNYANGFEEVAYGNCGGSDRCCTLQDNAHAVTEFWIIGGDSADTLAFSTSAPASLTLNGASSRTGIILGGNGGDSILGSTETSSSYVDKLYGEEHSDNIQGKNGDDIISGNKGNDTLHGNNGDDCIWGGLGYDELYGGNDDDTLFDECQGNGTDSNYMQGGPGNDDLWYEWDTVNCGANAVLDTSSGCNNGNTAGATDDFGEVTGSQTRPGDCDTTLTTEPTTCTGKLAPTPPGD